jgi:hypothetical protein
MRGTAAAPRLVEAPAGHYGACKAAVSHTGGGAHVDNDEFKRWLDDQMKRGLEEAKKVQVHSSFSRGRTKPVIVEKLKTRGNPKKQDRDSKD